MTRSTQTSLRPYYLLQLLAATFGILLSLYLLVQHTQLKSGIQAGASSCAFGAAADCDVVSASSYSEIWGIPTAATGTIYFFLLLILGLFAPPKDSNFRRIQVVLAWITLLAFLYAVYLAVIQIFVIQSICVFCFLSYLCTLSHLILNILMPDKQKLTKLSYFTGAFVPKKLSPLKCEVTKTALASLALACTISAVFLVPSRIWLESPLYSFVNEAVEQFYQEWSEKPSYSIEIKDTDSVIGNPSAKVKVVEFSDFECPHCQKAAFTLHTAVKALKDKAQLVFKHYPLDSSCNSKVHYPVHPNACKLATLAYCAQKKGKFWEFHDTVFYEIDRGSSSPDWNTIKTSLESIFTPEEISTCLLNDKATQNVIEDIRAGTQIGVKGTPAIYINGKQVTIPITLDTIKKLIELEAGQ